MSESDVEVELVRVVVHGSRFMHLVAVGQAITLCARVAEYRHRYQPRRSLCRRCSIEASKRGLAMPK